VLEIIQGKTLVAEASQAFGVTSSEIETGVDERKRGLENALFAKPEDVREQYQRQLKDLQEAYGEAMLEPRARKKSVPVGQGRGLMVTIQQGLKADGITVSMMKLCRWFEVARCSVPPADEGEGGAGRVD